jgi:hypothetical protein
MRSTEVRARAPAQVVATLVSALALGILESDNNPGSVGMCLLRLQPMSSLLLPTSIVAVALAMLALITASDFVFWAVPRLLRVEALGGGSSWWATDDGFAGGVFVRTFFCESLFLRRILCCC